jgi:O-antigen ligase
MIREHGNSYLAIMEWSGLLGVLPFYLLVCTAAWQACKAFGELRRSGNIFSPAVPAAAVIIAGLIGAMFEDWLFAVGYYVSVFFWSMTFILSDLVQLPVATEVNDPLVNEGRPLAALAVR